MEAAERRKRLAGHHRRHRRVRQGCPPADQSQGGKVLSRRRHREPRVEKERGGRGGVPVQHPGGRRARRRRLPYRVLLPVREPAGQGRDRVPTASAVLQPAADTGGGFAAHHQAAARQRRGGIAGERGRRSARRRRYGHRGRGRRPPAGRHIDGPHHGVHAGDRSRCDG